MTSVLVRRRKDTRDGCTEKRLCGHREKVVVCERRRGALEETNPADTLISDL